MEDVDGMEDNQREDPTQDDIDGLKNMGTSWRGPGTVLWTVQLCDIIIASIALGAAFIYLKFMLVPLTMAYMTTYMMAPVLDALEKRPYSCRGKMCCETAGNNPERYEVEYEEVETESSDEDGGKSKTEKKPVLDEDGNPKLLRDEHGNLVLKSGAALAAKDLVLMGKIPHGIACLLTLVISFGILGLLFSLIANSFSAFLEGEEQKEKNGEESIGQKLNEMLNEQLSGIDIITQIDCMYPNMTDIQVSSTTMGIADYFESSIDCGNILDNSLEVEYFKLKENSENQYCTSIYDPIQFEPMGTSDYERGSGARTEIENAADETDCALKVEEAGLQTYNYHTDGICAGYANQDTTVTDVAASSSNNVKYGFTDDVGCDHETIATQRQLLENGICSSKVHESGTESIDTVEALGFSYLLTQMDYDSAYVNGGVVKLMTICPLTCADAYENIVHGDEEFTETEASMLDEVYFTTQVMPVRVDGFQRYTSFEYFGNCTKSPVFGGEESEYEFTELVESAGAAMTIFSDVILVVMLAIFILLERPEGSTMQGDHPMVHEIEEMINVYIQLKTALSFLTGLLVGIILTTCGVQLSIIFGLLAFLLNFIPSIGSIIASILPIPIIILDDNISDGVKAFAIIGPGCVQGYVGNALEPMLFGTALNVTAISVLLSLVVFGYVWGLCGAILSTPFIGVIKIICHHTDHAVSKGILNLVVEDQALLQDPNAVEEENVEEEDDDE